MVLDLSLPYMTVPELWPQPLAITALAAQYQPEHWLAPSVTQVENGIPKSGSITTVPDIMIRQPVGSYPRIPSDSEAAWIFSSNMGIVLLISQIQTRPLT